MTDGSSFMGAFSAAGVVSGLVTDWRWSLDGNAEVFFQLGRGVAASHPCRRPTCGSSGMDSPYIFPSLQCRQSTRRFFTRQRRIEAVGFVVFLPFLSIPRTFYGLLALSSDRGSSSLMLRLMTDRLC